MEARQRLQPVPLTSVTVDGPFWGPRLRRNRTVTLPIEYRQLERTGRLDAWKLMWREGDPNQPHHFWDSDVAKWIEAAGYSLATHPDPDLEALVDEVIADIAKAQQPDGYLNIYYTVVEPDGRWSNLRDMHELYCAGHLMEAAVAYYGGTGKRVLLDVMCRYADLIAETFGRDEGQMRGYPGHEEIELALVKLYRATGRERYLALASTFVDERGQLPHVYDQEARARGDDPADYYGLTYAYNQSHVPVREQQTAVGHAVRAMYLYAGMVDVALETGDETLMEACQRLWENVTRARMYVTGGIGSSTSGERFTCDYDLPNEIAYAETCAAIGLVFWAHRMLLATGDGAYADVMERALYNGVLSGVSLDGERFFYANPLAVDPARHACRPDLIGSSAVADERQEWFGCACCPPNIARLLASLGAYVYSLAEDGIWVHLYTGGEATVDVGGQPVRLRQETRYPWQGEVRLSLDAEADVGFSLALRVPGWCRRATLEVNGVPVGVEPLVERGYIHLERVWQPGDQVRVVFDMPIERLEAHPQVKDACGRVALQRGPMVYCLEEVDNGVNLADIALPADARLISGFRPSELGGVVVIEGDGVRRSLTGWQGQLYRQREAAAQAVPVRAIPYYAWANRGLGEMMVWIREA